MALGSEFRDTVEIVEIDLIKFTFFLLLILI
jgi:hypothetical protein